MTDQTLVRLIRNVEEKIQTTNQNEKRDITTDPIDIKKIIRKYYKQLYVHIFDSLDEMDQFPEEYKDRKSVV